MSGDGHMIIIRSRADVARQAREAIDTIVAKNGGTQPARLRDAYDVDPEAFGLLIEALVALGASVDKEMRSLARLRPIDEVL